MEFEYKNSKKHHYIPKFYLKGFTNENGTFAVYDKLTGRIKKGEHFPDSHFFEFNRNTLEIEGNKTDFLETKLYSKLDDDLAPFFQKIRESDIQYLTFENLFPIKMFISFLFWRIPRNDQLIQDILKDEKLSNQNLFYQKRDTNESISEEEFNKIKKNPLFQRLYSFVLPFTTFKIEPHVGEENYWKAIGDPSAGINLTSDNPIILKREDIFYGEGQIMLVPITSNKMILYGQTDHIKILPPEFYLQCDLAIMHQSERYVCGPSKKYLEDILELYKIEKEFNKTHEIIPKLFRYLE
jgi:hypothetical protein